MADLVAHRPVEKGKKEKKVKGKRPTLLMIGEVFRKGKLIEK
jgi:hypothetical protein